MRVAARKGHGNAWAQAGLGRAGQAATGQDRSGCVGLKETPFLSARIGIHDCCMHVWFKFQLSALVAT